MALNNDGSGEKPSQRDVLEWLATQAVFPDGGRTSERIDTHAAIVFLAGQHAYKVKRAVALPYLDFSSLKARHAVCLRELELNRRTAPELYLSVRAVTFDPAIGLAIDGNGEPVEWLIEMRHFDNDLLFDRLARAGRLERTDIEALGDDVAAFHAGAEVSRDPACVDALEKVCQTTFQALARMPDVLNVAEVSRAAEIANDEFARLRPKLIARAETGCVRHCHGDLHLKNIVRIDGRPVIFDALEFDARLSTIDVLYDLAFLLMDLWDHDLPDFANVVLNRYLWAGQATRHYDALDTLPLFLALRSAVRAMVAIDQCLAAPEHAGTKERTHARHYFASARKFLQPAPPRLVAIGGRSGTGKSTVAARLAHRLGPAPGAVQIRTDVLRKAALGVPLSDRLPKSAYTEQSSARVYADVEDLARRVLTCGHAAIIDAAFLKPEERARTAAIAAQCGVRFDGIWLDLAEDERLARVGARQGDASDADAAVVRMQSGFDVGAIDWHIVNAAGSVDDVAERVSQVLLRGDGE